MIPITVWTYKTDGSLLKIFLYLYAGFHFTIGVGAITLFVVGTHLRLKTISEILAMRIRKEEAWEKREPFEKSDEEVFTSLAQIYQELMEICDDMNFCYGFQIMLAFGLMFFYTLFTFFTAYTDFMVVKYLTDVTISSIGFALYYNFVLLAVIFACIVANQQVKNN